MKKTALITILLFTLIIFSACKKDDDFESVISDKVTNVYSYTEVAVPEGYAADLFTAPTYYDGTFTSTVFKSGVYGRQEHILTFDANGENAVIADDSAFGETVNDGTFIRDRFALSNGGSAATEMYSTENLMKMYLTVHDGKGKLLFNIDIPEVFGYNLNNDIDDLAGDGFKVANVISAPYGEDELFIVLSTEGICAIDEKGAVKWTNTKQKDPTSIASVDVGVLYLYGQTLKTVNLDDGSLGDKIELPASLSSENTFDDPKFIIGEGYDFYVKNRLALWGVTLEKADDGSITASPTEVLNWLNSDIPESDVYEMCIVNPQLIAATYSDMMADGYSVKVVLLKMIPSDELVEKEIIKLAALTEEWYLQYAVTKFNRQSTTHRVVVTDFMQYDEDARKTRFDAEIAGGNAPDIVIIGVDSNRDTSVDSYIKNGIFTDLKPLMQADESLDYDDLLGCVTKPYEFYGGKQQVFPLRPNFTTLVGRAEDFDGPITPEEMIDLHNSLDDDTWVLQSDGMILKSIMAYSFNEFIDYENATCSFDDPRFIELLAPDLKERGVLEFEKHSYLEEYFIQGKMMLHENNSLSNLYRWAELVERVGGDIVNVGYPNTSGVVAVEASLGGYFAVLENSKYKKEAIDFLEVYMAQTSNRTGFSALTYRKSDIDRDLEYYKDKTMIIDGNKVSVLSDVAIDDSKPGRRLKITEKHAEGLKKFLDSVDVLVRYDTQARQMFNDEYYSESAKSAEEIADILQSRVSVYLSEQFG